MNMQKEELLEAFKAFDAKTVAQPLAGPKTDLDKRLEKRRRDNAPKAKRQRLARL